MTNWIDYKELREQLDFATILQHYGVELKITGEQHHGFCPLSLHKGKRNSASFSANIKRGIWQCFGCGQHGNILDFAVLMESLDPKKGDDVKRVALKLQDQFPNSASKANGTEKAAPESESANVVINAPLDFELKGLDSKEAHLALPDFDHAIIRWFGLGFCSRGLLKGRIAIPLHDLEGRLVGYAGRLVDDSAISEENPKYKLPGRRKRRGVIHEFRKSRLLYNAHRVMAAVEVPPVMDLVVVEGFKGVWWLWQARIRSAVGLMGSTCSEEQARQIISLVDEVGRVWVMTDGNAAGERCAHAIIELVAQDRAVRWVQLDNNKQPTDYAPAELRRFLPFAPP